MVIRTIEALIAALVFGVSVSSAQIVFPNWTVEPLGLSGVWERASFIVIGSLRDVHPIGSVRPATFPAMSSPNIRLIYWCEGNFEWKQVIRGQKLFQVTKYRWGAIRPGCGLEMEARLRPDEPLTEVWFLREEGGYLRPVIDAGGPLFFTLHTKWEPNSPGLEAERYFGKLLLSPTAIGFAAPEFARSFFKPAGLACWILGKDDCIPIILRLAATYPGQLHDAACEFLKSDLTVMCVE